MEKPVDRIVDKPVDNPVHLATIARLTAEVAVVAGLRSQIVSLEARPPVIVDRIVEKPIDRVVERVVEKPVDRVVEKLVPDTQGLEERDRQIASLNTRINDLTRTIGERDTQIVRFRTGADIDVAAARSAGFVIKGADNLEIVEGIGPKIAQLLRDDGITTFHQLANASPAQVRLILDRAGPTFRIADPGTWPEQAGYAARNEWQELARLQKDELDAGVRRPDMAPINALHSQLAERDAEIARLKARPKLDKAAAKEAGFNVRGDDDLQVIEGIGPKIADLLRADGITTFAELAVAPVARIQGVLDRAGPSFKLAKPETWPEQSALAADNNWRALKTLQDQLNAGKR